jgi:hypothetical protein
MFHLTTLSSSDYTVSKGHGILALRMKRPWPNWRYCRGICLQGQRKTMVNTVSFRTGHFHSRSEAISSVEREACELKMARVIHCCLHFLFKFLLPVQRLYIVKNMCVCAHVWLRVIHFTQIGSGGLFLLVFFLILRGSRHGGEWSRTGQTFLQSSCQTGKSSNPCCFQIFLLIAVLVEAVIIYIIF